MRYRFYDYVRDDVHYVKCISHYAHRPVSAVAKCDPQDEFDLEEGKRIAQERVDQKVRERRYARAKAKVREAETQLAIWKRRLEEARQFQEDAYQELKNEQK